MRAIRLCRPHAGVLIAVPSLPHDLLSARVTVRCSNRSTSDSTAGSRGTIQASTAGDSGTRSSIRDSAKGPSATSTTPSSGSLVERDDRSQRTSAVRPPSSSSSTQRGGVQRLMRDEHARSAEKRAGAEEGKGRPSRSSASTQSRVTPGKVHRQPLAAATAETHIKVRKRAPWGVQQLRDSWSEDAMTKRENDGLGTRVRREYRYHPEEPTRQKFKYAGLSILPAMIVGASMGYYSVTGNPIWKADPQHLLNMIRVMDTSPRSNLYAYGLEESARLPPHVQAYREANYDKKLYAERLFKVTNSAFERPNEAVLRRLELEEWGEDSGEGDDIAGQGSERATTAEDAIPVVATDDAETTAKA